MIPKCEKTKSWNERDIREKTPATEELSERAKVWSHAPPGANQESLLDSTIHVASLSTFLLLWLIWTSYPTVLSKFFFSACAAYAYDNNRSINHIPGFIFNRLGDLGTEMIEFDYS